MCYRMERNEYGIIISWPLGAMTNNLKKQPIAVIRAQFFISSFNIQF